MSSEKHFICIISLIIFIFSFPTFADFRDDAKIIKISGGENHTLILTQNKWPWGCGDNRHYQLGIGYGTGMSKLLFRTLEGAMDSPSDYLEDINDIDAGWQHSLALDVDGFVWAWGQNDEGQLGDGSQTESSTPIGVKGGEMETDFLQEINFISAGRSGLHSLAVDVNGLTYAWGSNDEGQLGDANQPNDALTPVKVHGGAMGTEFLEDIIAISAGEQHSMALDSNGFVYTWGDNAYNVSGRGKLGIGNEDDDYIETPVKVLKGEQQSSYYLENIVAISAGWDHSMALEDFVPFDQDRQGRVYTWGNNGQCHDDYPGDGGRLGNGTIGDENSSSTPVLVLSGEQDPCNEDTALRWIVDVSAGEDHCLALDANGFVWSWGMNDYGQLGNGTNDTCTTPVKVVGPDGKEFRNIVAIAAGFWHSLAIDADGNIWVWGMGWEGRLALGDQEHKLYAYPRPAVFNLTQQTFYFGIQPAIDNANNSGDVIEASKGTYFEDVDFRAKTIILKSTDPNNWQIVKDTIIQGSGTNFVSAVWFYGNPDSILTGFTITNGYDGIECEFSSPDINNCIIENCARHGLYCDYSTVEVTNCKISDNGNDGVYCEDSEILLKNCIISGNNGNGIYSNAYQSIEIKNNWIYDNGADGIGNGIHIHYANPDAIIRNNTIADNKGYGLYSRYGDDVTVRNCIIWGNVNGSLQKLIGEFDNITYNCIEGGFAGGTGNIDSDPCFVNDSNDNYHISFYSPCKDTGDSNDIPYGETDIDGEARIMYDKIDIGADEYYWSPADFDISGLVDFTDYAILANAFMFTPPDPNYVEKCDLDSNDIINLADLELFCEEWLWETPWNFGGEEMMMYMGGGDGKAGALMLDTEQSLIARPQRLAEQEPVYIDENVVEEVLKWTDELWLENDELRKYMTEEEFLEFRKLIEEDLLRFLNSY